MMLIVLCGLAGACADSKKPATQPASVRDRQEQALRDPFGYGPEEEMPTVSGGGKKGIKRDWDSFWK